MRYCLAGFDIFSRSSNEYNLKISKAVNAPFGGEGVSWIEMGGCEDGGGGGGVWGFIALHVFLVKTL